MISRKEASLQAHESCRCPDLIFYELIRERQVTAEWQQCFANLRSQEWWPKYLSR